MFCRTCATIANVFGWPIEDSFYLGQSSSSHGLAIMHLASVKAGIEEILLRKANVESYAVTRGDSIILHCTVFRMPGPHCADAKNINETINTMSIY